MRTIPSLHCLPSLNLTINVSIHWIVIGRHKTAYHTRVRTPFKVLTLWCTANGKEIYWCSNILKTPRSNIAFSIIWEIPAFPQNKKRKERKGKKNFVLVNAETNLDKRITSFYFCFYCCHNPLLSYLVVPIINTLRIDNAKNFTWISAIWHILMPSIQLLAQT